MPSYLESLSMVALEAWAMGKPVLANAKCDVLQGQCIRSNAGLFYENFDEFAEALRAIDMTPSLQAALGRNGRAFFERHYAWPVIEKKYVDMLTQLSKESAPRKMEPSPGWFTRRRKSQLPADSIVKNLPAGAYREPARAEGDRKAEGRTQKAEVMRSEPRRDFQRDPRGPRPESRRPDQQQPFDSRSGRAATGALAQGKQQQRPAQQQRPQQQRPQQQQQQQSRPPQQQQRPPQEPRPEGGQPPRPEGDRQRDQRRGRPHRRGRRPGGGGGGAR